MAYLAYFLENIHIFQEVGLVWQWYNGIYTTVGAFDLGASWDTSSSYSMPSRCVYRIHERMC